MNDRPNSHTACFFRCSSSQWVAMDTGAAALADDNVSLSKGEKVPNFVWAARKVRMYATSSKLSNTCTKCMRMRSVTTATKWFQVRANIKQWCSAAILQGTKFCLVLLLSTLRCAWVPPPSGEH
jgi:hypothetical protein